MNNKIKNTQRAFGIEIECIIPAGISDDQIATAVQALGVDCRREQYNHSTRRHWKVIYDASVHGQNGGRGVELVSPKLFGTDGLQQIEKVCQALNALGATVNRTCGLHVHHDASDFASKHFSNVKHIYQQVEPTLDGIMPASRRGNANQYCRSVVGANENNWSRDRYYKLNLTSYTRHGTVEFRHHSGTTNATKIIAWVHLTQAIMERAKGSKMRTATQTNLQYFFYGLHMDNRHVADVETRELYAEVRRYFSRRLRAVAA